jgi:hypothetical protein
MWETPAVARAEPASANEPRAIEDESFEAAGRQSVGAVEPQAVSAMAASTEAAPSAEPQAEPAPAVSSAPPQPTGPATRVPPRGDPLAALKAMTDEERIALFS